MKAKDLFAWHYRHFALFLKYQKTVFSFHPSLYLYSQALQNERMKAPFRFVPSSYFQRAEILTKSKGVLIISTCSIIQMNCMFWQTQAVRFFKTYSSLWKLPVGNPATAALLLLCYAPVVLKLHAYSQTNADGQEDECPPVIGKKALVNVLIFVNPSCVHS